MRFKFSKTLRHQENQFLLIFSFSLDAGMNGWICFWMYGDVYVCVYVCKYVWLDGCLSFMFGLLCVNVHD